MRHPDDRHDDGPVPGAGRDGSLDPELRERLRQAWSQVPPPPATPALDGTDARTRRTVDWMARAWAALPAPATDVPLAAHARLAEQRRRRRWVARRGVRHLAAAAVLLAVGLALWLGPAAQLATSETGDDTAASAPAASGAADPSGADLAQAAPGADVPPDDPSPTGATEPAAAGRVSAGPDHLELRSGPVRLVLVTSPVLPDAPPR